MINDQKKAHVEISYQPAGESENHLRVNGFDIAGIASGFSVYGDVPQFPEVSLNLCVRKVDIDTEAYIKFNDIVVPEILARGIYEQLHARFGTANNGMEKTKKDAGQN